MHKLRRFFHQNKYQILKTLGIIAFILIIIQVMNYFVKENNNKEIVSQSQNTTNVNEDNKGLVSEKSAVTGKDVSKEQLDSATTVINKFISYCNQQDLESAYNLLTDECKQQIYSNKIEVFEQSYYKNIFDGEKKNCIIENWVGNIYKINITGDLLATGKDDGGYSKQDYITVKKVNGEYKLNINNYIGYSEINKTTTENNISIKVISKNTYKDYEEYTIKATNNTESTMELDNISSTETLYLEDSKGIKYPYYNHELTTPMITVPAGQTREVTIKFYNSYVSTKRIDYMVFSNIILKNGELAETTKLRVNI